MEELQQIKRKLASIQKIINIHPIEGADKIETVQVLEWECVCKKGEFKIGDLIVYCEIDSILPEKPEFEFLRERKFRIKTIKLRKQISQGIIFPLSILPNPFNHYEGEDVTEVLGIKKYDPQLQEENELKEKQSKSKINKFLMKFSWYRYIYFKLHTKNKGWPSWISHTNEERIQSCSKLLINNLDKNWYITEKLDGQSATFFTDTIKKWGIKKLIFGVCSRNIRLSKPDKSNYWIIAKKLNIGNKLLNLKKSNIVMQGEIIGPKIQDNKYQLKELDFFVFNIIENGIKYSLEQMIEFCDENELKTVPILYDNYSVKDSDKKERSEIIKDFISLSTNKSTLNKEIWQEGIVVRIKNNPDISFKVINPEFLLKYPN